MSKIDLQAPVQAKGVVHKLVADTAKAMAATFYDEAAHDNDFYRVWPSEKMFVRRRWHSFIQPARDALVTMLSPDFKCSYNEEQNQRMKLEIYDALRLNAMANPASNSPLN